MNIERPKPTPKPPDAGKHFRAEAGIAQPAQAKILLRTDSLNPRNKQTDARKGEDLRQKRFLSPRCTALFLWQDKERGGYMARTATGANSVRRSGVNPCGSLPHPLRYRTAQKERYRL